ncbi:TraB/GumN family protein [Sandarakinorhabdus sp. AAP62]|uniref:TraB/GumN family protein n=1 Tax=Sandarakinorhabdus sp. AAP62 TaxID=1248916 RepID=UPI0003808DB1|nr:TraB/GumN family protein [Sandarakinorhabdus sp. AAP62]
MMLHRLFLILCLWLASPAWAVPAMWQVGQGKRQITLYGTIHALPKGTDWLTPQAAQAFNRAGTLVVEIAGPSDPAAMRAVVMELGRLPTPVPLASRLPDELKPKADALLKAAGLPVGALDGMESWLAALTLVQIEVARAGLDPAAGVDVALIARARAAGKRLIGLETARGQLALFDSLPEADQRLLLASAIADAGKTVEQMQGLVAAWGAGDVDRILKDFDDASLSPELEKRLFHDRNAAWANWVQAALKRPGRKFMAVGAAHMAGPHSLIAMLQARGIPVKRVQ